MLFLCFLDVVNKQAVPDAGGFARAGHLEGDELAVIAHDRVGSLVTGIIAEKSEPLVLAAAIELKFPKVHKSRPLAILFIALDQCELTIGKNPFGLIVLARRVGVVDHLLRHEVDATNIGALIDRKSTRLNSSHVSE